ncbi:ComEC/Rec2 family competence protein [Bacillus sp. JCM 19041]|uniref:ComEC/Rec2 family competence protein n=1 Tax=Bacillus sp. JCM 19041 TaxID=1460637 RepID=UPI0006D24CE7
MQTFKRITSIVSLILFVTIVLTSHISVAKFNLQATTSVEYLDVGQGDSTLIRSGDTTILIDTGGNRSTLDHLEERGVNDLDLLILTHAHADHIMNADVIVNEMSPDEVWMSETEATSQVYERLLDALIETNISVEYPEVGDSYSVGPLDFTIAHPSNLTGDLNNDSLSFRMIVENTSFLFTGDAEERAENMMLEAGVNLQSDIYHMGHHGSSTSSSSAFMSAVLPEIAIYSAGVDNSYGHPHPEAIESVQSVGAQVYGTAEDGTVTVNVTNTGYTVQTER